MQIKAESGRFNGEFRYLSVTCPKCFDLHLRQYFSACCIEFLHNKQLDLTFNKPQSSGYYATQYFQSPFLREKAVRKSSQVPVMSRITINGTMSQFSCKLTVRSSLWNAKANKASGKSLESQCVNEKLENIKTNIHK